ncbi:hypothetical protein Vretimale_2668 [Volvox reticuliferus]|uniref:Uncharacterized protein n=1 Tax=Volvox reticuliferus TaxID=1737510 RepID=A0A8J4D741_9CHLO|nr:hypothetical protein Vretifemale_2020 [Volvox reticuliferus]GIL96947.1 hypothetical protein Vretimale_2668 [Volvox reticuliferus]
MYSTTGYQRLAAAAPLHPHFQTMAHAAGAGGGGTQSSGRGVDFSSGVAFLSDRLSLASISTPVSATSADLDDAIMESVETELFESDGIGCSQATCFTTSSQFMSGSSAMACLVQGFSHLPDRVDGSSSTTSRMGCDGVGVSGGAASASAVTGGGNGNASTTLTEALRFGGGVAMAACGGGSGAGHNGAALSHIGANAVETLTLKPSGISHDGVTSTAYSRTTRNGIGAAPAYNRAGGLQHGDRPTASAERTASVPEIPMAAVAGADTYPPLCTVSQSELCQNRIATQAGSKLQPTCNTAAMAAGAVGGAARQASQLEVNTVNSLSRHAAPSPLPVSSVPCPQPQPHAHIDGWVPGLESCAPGVCPMCTRCVPPACSCSSASSTVHPAFVQLLGGTALAAAAVSQADLNLPFTAREGAVESAGGISGGIGAPALGLRLQPFSWHLGPRIGNISPTPVAESASIQSHGSIAAAAFRSVSSVAGHPSLAVPYGSGNTAAGHTDLAPSSMTEGGGTRGGVGCSRRRQVFGQEAAMWRSEPWGAAEAREQPNLAAGGGGAAGAAFPLHQLFDVLPDITVGCRPQSDQDGDPPTTSAAAITATGAGGDLAGGGGPDVVSAAVQALLRLDQPFDLPYAQKLPSPGHATTPRRPSANGANPRDANTDDSYAPVLPPVEPLLPSFPLPASVVASLDPSGVPAIDRYLQQLLQDSSTERHVFLCKRSLGHAACRAIASCLTVCPGIMSITLSYCGITCEGVSALCSGLHRCRDLLVLDLSYNNIGDGGAAELAACLAHMPQLASLTLAGNLDLTDVGVAALTTAVRGCSALRRVGLRGTAASQQGLRELASVLAGNMKRSARRVSGAPGSPVAGGGGVERPITWDGTVGSAAAAAGASDAVFIAQLCALLRTLVQPALAAEQAVAEAVVELMSTAPSSLISSGGAAPSTVDGSAGAGGGKSDLLLYLADGLTARGYDVAVTHALGGGSGGECLRNLRHTFLSVSCPLAPGVVPSGPPSPAAAAVAAASLARSSGSSPLRQRGSANPNATPPPYHPGVIIVDPELREQFEVAMPTSRYEALVSALPRVYVGAEERLPLVVEVLCDEMALALRSKGMVIPPWRESSAMISKWQPKQSKLLVPGATGGDHMTVFSAGPGSGSASARSSASVTPRVSLAGGMAALITGGAAGGFSTAPMQMQQRRPGGAGASTFAAVKGGDRKETWRATAPNPTDGGDEPSLGPAPSLGSGSGADSSRPDSNSLVQSFGFRRCTSANSMSMSVGLLGPISRDGGGVNGISRRSDGNGAAETASPGRLVPAGLTSAFAGLPTPAARTEDGPAASTSPIATAASAVSSGCISLGLGLALGAVPSSPPSPPYPCEGASTNSVAVAVACEGISPAYGR